MDKLIRRRGINIFVLSSSLYVSFQLIANILSTKIAILPFLNLAIDGGTVIYPLTFTLRDFVHKTHGKRDARQVIIIAAALNAVMFGLFWLVGKMTPDPTWQFQAAYEQILLPVGRIVLASIVAQVISELVDTEIFSYVYKKISDTPAVFFSNSISLVIDSFIFCFIAFLGTLSLSTVLQIVVANILIKFVISTLSVPTIKLIPRTAKFEDI
jgi:queuosine precursor transporter